jgi:ribosomal protein S18 acetylase RimI-like enzyme
MVAVIVRGKSEDSGLRPMDPGRDLAGVAKLIQTAFADELDRAGRAALREMRNMSRLGPLVWWLNRASVEFSELLSGFVWVEEGQVVGNVTVSRAAPGSYRWIISNVAVAEPYRGRGIARTLVDAAIELIREWGGKVASLQVRDNNASAVHLYRSMGFQEIFGTAYLRLLGAPGVEPVLIGVAHLRPRRFTPGDARMDYDLALAFTSEKVQVERPVRLAHFRLGFEQHLADGVARLVGGGPTLRLVLTTDHRFLATITAEAGTWWRESRVLVKVHPSLRGQVEAGLISHALHHLGRWPGRTILVRHPTYHPEGIEAFKSFGFQEERTLLWMRCDL